MRSTYQCHDDGLWVVVKPVCCVVVLCVCDGEGMVLGSFQIKEEYYVMVCVCGCEATTSSHDAGDTHTRPVSLTRGPCNVPNNAGNVS